jgi:F0F1-type ATP synthase membrane subunit b/b'
MTGTIEYSEMANHHKERATASSTARRKSAMDELLDSFAETIDSGAEKMTPSELRESEKRFNEIADRVASRKRRRETA